MHYVYVLMSTQAHALIKKIHRHANETQHAHIVKHTNYTVSLSNKYTGVSSAYDDGCSLLMDDDSAISNSSMIL